MRLTDNNSFPRAQEAVVVIDPGHGGTGGGADDGAVYNGVTERYLTVATAKAMAEELSKYEGVTVYLTHDSADTHMTLRERAEFAQSVQADYLISLHYNASEEHIFYGSEVWIPSIGEYYVKGYGIAEAVLSGFREKGLHIRGIKTRIGDGNDEYYGIIRESEWRDITGIIVEHCYLDNLADKSYFDEASDYESFGRTDATAMARYLGLKSPVTGEDFTGYRGTVLEAPTQRVYQDTTPPDKCELRLSEPLAGNGQLAFCVEAHDPETAIGYYAYSFDGGQEFSELFEWRDMDGDGREDVIISNLERERADFVVRVYNNCSLYTDSRMLSLEGINASSLRQEIQPQEKQSLVISRNEQSGSKPAAGKGDWKVGGGIAFIMAGMVCSLLLYRRSRRKKKSEK